MRCRVRSRSRPPASVVGTRLGLVVALAAACDAKEHAARNKLRWDVQAAASQSAL